MVPPTTCLKQCALLSPPLTVFANTTRAGEHSIYNPIPTPPQPHKFRNNLAGQSLTGAPPLTVGPAAVAGGHETATDSGVPPGTNATLAKATC